MPRSTTKERLLDRAEELFAQQGFAATSLRQVIGRAKVNLAAIHYHFGSKQELIRAVLERRLAPLNAERLRLLDACETRAGKKPLRVELVLEALVGPALRLSRDPDRGGDIFMRLLGRIYTEPNEEWQTVLTQQLEVVARRFSAAFERALPHLPTVDLFWRIHFSIGAMAHTMADTERLKILSNGLCNPHPTEDLIDRLITFLAGGMRAPARKRPARRPKP